MCWPYTCISSLLKKYLETQSNAKSCARRCDMSPRLLLTGLALMTMSFAAQKAVAQIETLVMPGDVIEGHAEYETDRLSHWTEIYATDEAFQAHLANEKAKAPLGAVVEACGKITCRCFGDPNEASREILAGFGTTYHESAADAFVLNPNADPKSKV